eukprot:PhM_4_TR778/c0_g1_i1/m.91325
MPKNKKAKFKKSKPTALINKMMSPSGEHEFQPLKDSDDDHHDHRASSSSPSRTTSPQRPSKPTITSSPSSPARATAAEASPPPQQQHHSPPQPGPTENVYDDESPAPPTSHSRIRQMYESHVAPHHPAKYAAVVVDHGDVMGEDPDDGVEMVPMDEPPTTAAHDDHHHHHSTGHGTVFSTVTAIVSNMVGGGVLALSAAFDNASIIFGIFVLLLIAAVSLYSMYIIILMCERTHRQTFLQIWQHAFPSERLSWVIGSTIVWYAFGTCVAFIVIIQDSMGPLAEAWMGLTGFPADGRFWALLVSPFLFMFTSVKSMAELTVTSVMAFLTILYVGVMVVIRYFEQENSPTVNWAGPDQRILKAFTVMTFCFSMHFNLPPLYRELKHRSPQKMMRVAYLSMAIVMVFYLVVAMIGYLAWGDRILSRGGDLLAQYSDDDSAMNIGRMFMLVHFVCVFPLQGIACRRSANTMLFGGEGDFTRKGLCAEAAIIVGLSLLLGAFLGKIDEVVAFNGSLFGTHIVLTFPAFMFWRLFPEMSMKHKVLCVLQGSSGIFLSISGVIITIMDSSAPPEGE